MSTTAEQFKTYVLDRTRAVLQAQGYSGHTETVYLHWIRQFLAYSGATSPQRIRRSETESFLDTLSGLKPSTYRQARSALQFLKSEVLKGWMLEGGHRAEVQAQLKVASPSGMGAPVKRGAFEGQSIPTHRWSQTF